MANHNWIFSRARYMFLTFRLEKPDFRVMYVRKPERTRQKRETNPHNIP